jgi:hypothetical protein
MLMKYENHRPSDILLQVILVAALWYFLPQKYWNIPVIFGVISIPYVIAEQRIAVMFTDHEVIYRPAFRSPRRIKFEHIAEIRKISVRRYVAGTFSGLDPGWLCVSTVVRLFSGACVYRMSMKYSSNFVQ